MKNYFIANREVLDTTMTIEEIESAVNDSLEETTGGMVSFAIEELSENHVIMKFIREFNINPDKPVIYDTDANIISGIGLRAFTPKKMGGYPLISPLCFNGKNFYTDITTFIQFYKTLLLFSCDGEEGFVEEIGIRCYPDCIIMKITY
jgi:hypothetical protein